MSKSRHLFYAVVLEREETMNLVYGVKDKPNPLKWFVLSLQHVFAMFGATVLVPILVGIPISTALLSSGVGTIIYFFITRQNSPVYLGSSFAYIAPLIAVIAYNKSNAASNYMLAVVTVGLIYVAFSLIFRFLGTKWFYKMLPPIVIGPVIMIIGLSLSSVAVDSTQILEIGTGTWKEPLTSLITIAIIISALILGKSVVKTIPVLIGIVLGYLFALIIGIVDISPIAEASLFALPEVSLPIIDYQLQFDFEVLVIVIPVSIVTMAEHIGDHIVLGSIINKNLLKEPGLKRTMLGDGLATIFAGLIGGPVNTTYAENTGVISLTKIASVYVILTAGITAIILSMIGVFTAAISTIPASVMGGVSVILFGLIALNGVRVLVENEIDLKNERNVLMLAIMLVLGVGGAAGINVVINDVKFVVTSVVLTAVSGIILHLLLPNKEVAYGKKNLETDQDY